MSIAHWPEAERPREKLLSLGPRALSDAELLAIFLRVGCVGKSAVDLARELLQQYGGLRPLLEASQAEFSGSFDGDRQSSIRDLIENFGSDTGSALRSALQDNVEGRGREFVADTFDASGLTLLEPIAEPVLAIDYYGESAVLINGALELGGDAVATVGFTNGDTQKVNAGQGISVGVGGELSMLKNEQFRLRGSIGIKYVTTAADNAHIRLTRIPMILTANWVIEDDWRIGAGIVSHQAIRFNAGGLGGDFSLSSPAGPVIEVAYKGIGLSYTILTYEDEFGDTYGASAIGLTFSGVVPKRK